MPTTDRCAHWTGLPVNRCTLAAGHGSVPHHFIFSGYLSPSEDELRECYCIDLSPLDDPCEREPGHSGDHQSRGGMSGWPNLADVQSPAYLADARERGGPLLLLLVEKPGVRVRGGYAETDPLWFFPEPAEWDVTGYGKENMTLQVFEVRDGKTHVLAEFAQWASVERVGNSNDEEKDA